MNNKLSAYKNLSIKQNVAIQVIDEATGAVVQEHVGHNSATNSLLYGIAHHLAGDFLPNEAIGLHPAYSMLANYVPRYISLGTMGLINQNQDSNGLPAGVGDTVPSSSDPEFIRLQEAMNAAKDALDAAKEALADDCQYWPACDACTECETCATRIGAKRQAVDDAQVAYTEAYDAFMNYNEEARFVEYMKHRPGYGADGYDANENNGRKYLGLGYAYSSYDVTEQYDVGDVVMYMGILYVCDVATSNPAGAFNTINWRQMDDAVQPSLGTTIQLELISPSFPRASIEYRDIVPEYQAEISKTIDVVFSAMISTGALKQFRPEGQDYIFITEAGLWSKRTWEDSGENGLLAGYRIVPPNDDNWDMTVPANRQILKENILKVGKNQVVQVVWKIQIGAIEKFDQDEPVPENYTKLSFHVIDEISEQQMSGVVIKITTDAAGEHVAYDARTQRELLWTTSDVKKVAYLNDGVYYMHQMTTPSGYATSNTISFELAEGVVTKIGDAGIIEGTDITMVEELIPYVPVESIEVYEDAEYTIPRDNSILCLNPIESAIQISEYPPYEIFYVKVLPENATNKSIGVRAERIRNDDGDYPWWDSPPRTDFASKITKLSDTQIKIEACCYGRLHSDMMRVYSLDNENIYQDIDVASYVNLTDVAFDVTPADLQMGLYEEKHLKLNLLPTHWTANHIEQTGVDRHQAEYPFIYCGYSGDANIYVDSTYEHEVPMDDPCLYGYIDVNSDNGYPGTAVISVPYYDENGDEQSKSVELTVTAQPSTQINFTNVPVDFSEYEPGDYFTVGVTTTPTFCLDNQYQEFYGYIYCDISGDGITTVEREYDTSNPGDCSWTVTAPGKLSLSYHTYYPEDGIEVYILGACTNVTISIYMTEYPNVTSSFLIDEIIDPSPTPSGADYDWDFTTSLVDTNGVDAEFFTDTTDASSITTTPATGQYADNALAISSGYYALKIPVDLLSTSTSYAVEIDFTDCTLEPASWNVGFVMNIAADPYTSSIVSGINTDFGAFSVDVYDSTGSFAASESSITSTTYFANSTMKIINRITSNNNVIWDFYKDNALVFSTDEYQSDGVTPFFWDNSVLQIPFAISGGHVSAKITGMRIYENN